MDRFMWLARMNLLETNSTFGCTALKSARRSCLKRRDLDLHQNVESYRVQEVLFRRSKTVTNGETVNPIVRHPPCAGGSRA